MVWGLRWSKTAARVFVGGVRTAKGVGGVTERDCLGEAGSRRQGVRRARLSGEEDTRGARMRGRGHGQMVDALGPPLRISRDIYKVDVWKGMHACTHGCISIYP
jgi:hypothetical protein